MNLRIAIDTNRLVDFFRDEPEAVTAVQEAREIFVPFVSAAELRAGFLGGKKGTVNERIFTKFLNSARVQILLANEETTHHYARLFQQLRKQGTPIPTNDLWIAALALQNDLPLLSRDRHFDSIPQLLRA